MRYPKITLKPNKETFIKNRHRWIFSGAVDQWPKNFENGSICQILSSNGNHLGYGYFNVNQSLSGRIISFNETDPLLTLEMNFLHAINIRNMFFANSNTNGFRLIHGEADGFPGLIIDKYDDVYVIQISTLGMEKLKPFIIDLLIKNCPLKAIIEKSDSKSRKTENLEECRKILYGTDIEKQVFLENGINYYSYVKSGQKTGFFLDQRHLRKLLSQISKNKKVLNCFSYTGGFSIASVKGGAQEVTSVDSSFNAIDWSKENMEINNLPEDSINFICEDVFSFFQNNNKKWDIIIIDPPAFAKKQKDVKRATQAYEKLNCFAMQALVEDGLLISCSCSHFIDKSLWINILKNAALKSNVSINLLSENYLSPDHPLNLFHTETQYLKTSVCSIRKNI